MVVISRLSSINILAGVKSIVVLTLPDYNWNCLPFLLECKTPHFLIFIFGQTKLLNLFLFVLKLTEVRLSRLILSEQRNRNTERLIVFVIVTFHVRISKTVVVYHLPPKSGKFGWNVNGKTNWTP